MRHGSSSPSSPLLPAVLALLLALPAAALDPATFAPAPGKPLAPTDSVSIRSTSLAALAALDRASTAPWQVRWDAASGLPARVDGSSTAEPMGATPEEAARNFLKSYADLFLLDDAGDSLKTRDVQASLGGQHVRMTQHVRGVPVFGAEVSVHMDRDLRVQAVNSAYVPRIAGVPATPVLSRDRALALARAAAKIEGRLRADPVLETVVWPAEKPVLAWHALLPADRPLGDFEVLLDASTGKLLSLQNLLRHAEAKGRIFDPNPVVTLKNNTLRDGNDADNAAWAAAYKEITLLGLDSSGKLKGQFVDATPGATEEPEAAASFSFHRGQKAFEQVMVYHHIDRAQRYIQSLGFTNINNRVQRASAHGTTDDNSWYSPATKELTFGDGGVDDAEDADIIMHEYGHSIQDNQVPGFGGRGEAGAMGEGFGDFLGSTMRADHGFQRQCVGSWDGTSYSNAPEPCLRRVDGTKHYPENLQNQVHADGEIWSACLWQIWNKLGKAVTDKLVLEAHFGLAPQAKFADGANSLIQADKNLFQGSHVKEIKAVFVARGILKSSAVLRVTLKEAQTGKPCGGRLTIQGLQGTVDIDPRTGTIEKEIAPGTYAVSVASFGYLTQEGRQVTVEEDQTASLEFALQTAPRFTVSGTVRRADTGESLSAKIIVADTPLDPVQTTGSAGTFSLALPAGKYTLKATAFGYRTGVLADVDVTADRTVEFKLAGLPPVLLVDDAEGAPLARFFKEAMAGTEFDLWTVKTDGALGADSLLAYPMVVWFTGADYRQTLTEADQALLGQYVLAGGRLFVTGQEIAYSLKEKPFLKDVLGAEFVADAAGSRRVKGFGVECSIEGGDGAANQQYPDVVKPAGEGAELAASYDGEQGAGIRLQRGGGRIVYLAFGFEAIATAPHRTAVMKAILGWLRPALAERVERLAALDVLRQSAPAADSAHWMALEEGYEKLMAREVGRASAADRAAIRGLLAKESLSRFRDVRAVLQAK